MPKALHPGDLIHVVSPASPITPEELELGLQPFVDWGYRIRLGAHVFDSNGYLAGSDRDRAEDLIAAFNDPESSLILCSRGGYGCARLFPYLNIGELADCNKLFAGFSDVTSLHLALNAHGLPTLHAPMPLTLNRERAPWVYQSLRRNLEGNVLVPAEAPKGRCLSPGSAEAKVTGGCLCLLCDSIGTSYPLDCEGKIVVIEDVDEPPHRVDAMLTHLINSGSIRQAAGIVVGEMTRTDERVDNGIGAWPWRDIVADRLGKLGIPTIVEYPIGHAPQMLTLPLGVRARIDADAGTLTFMESPCAD